MKFDDILRYLGQFGPYQQRVYALVCLPMMAAGMQALATVFTMAVPDHRCVLPEVHNDTYEAYSSTHAAFIQAIIPSGQEAGTLSNCKIRQLEGTNSSLLLDTHWNSSHLGNESTCERWVYDTSIYESTLISKLNLVCEDKMGRTVAQMFYMFGSVVGNLLLGPPADIFGRRKVLMFSIFFLILSTFSIALTPNFIFLCFIMMMTGAAVNAIISVTFVMGMELVGPKKRAVAGSVITCFFGVGVCLLSVLAYFIRDWQNLQFVISSVNLIFIVYYWFVPESPRWLVSKGRYAEAEKILKKAAEVNKKELSSDVLNWDQLENEKEGHEPIRHIFKYPRLIGRTLIIYLNWMVVSMTYYGISLNVADLAGSIYLNMFLYGLVEVVAIAACVFLLDRVGRRRIYLFCIITGGICCIASPFPSLYLSSDYQWVGIALAILGKAAVSTAFATIWLYTTEIFPTVVRNAGVSTSSLCARIGGVAAPYIANMGIDMGTQMGRILPLIIFGTASLVVGTLALILPETSHTTMPDTIQDWNNIGRTTDLRRNGKPKHDNELERL